MEIGTRVGGYLQTGLGYDVARDGRFLLNVPAEEQGRNSLVVIVNWAAQLPR